MAMADVTNILSQLKENVDDNKPHRKKIAAEAAK